MRPARAPPPILRSCHECLHTAKDENSLARAGLPTVPVWAAVVARSETGHSCSDFSRYYGPFIFEADTNLRTVVKVTHLLSKDRVPGGGLTRKLAQGTPPRRGLGAV